MSRLERWLVPGILVAVACVQLILANGFHLTPWKGGGFGMFSTVDGHYMRLVSCEGVTTTGVPIQADAPLVFSEEEWDNARAMPTRGALAAMAHRLLDSELVRSSGHRVTAAERFRQQNPDLKWDPGVSAPGEKELYRPVRSSDPDFADGEIVFLREVTLRWWRLNFDPVRKQVNSEPIGEEFTLSLPPPPTP